MKSLKPIHTTLFVLVMLLFNCLAYAQNVQISGKIIDSLTLIPVSGASVFIVNSTIGTKTDTNGNYSFHNLATGNYQLIVSCVGYQTRQSVTTSGIDKSILNFFLLPRIIQLKEVNIAANNNWKHNLSLFEKEFIGTTNPGECKIVNPDALNLEFDHKKNKLTASSDDFLDIENSILGYKLRFLVKDFSADYNSGRCHYIGTVIFEELTGDKKEEKKWKKNRADVFNGSFRHFLISLSNTRLNKDKYVVKRMYKNLNPQWKLDSTRHEQNNQVHPLKQAPTGVVRTFYVTQPKIIETIAEKQLSEADMMVAATQQGIFKLQFPGFLYVIYRNKTESVDTDDLYRAREAYDYQIAAISLKDPAKPIIFNSKGDLITKEGLLFEGAWSSRIIDLLPDDYMPEAK